MTTKDRIQSRLNRSKRYVFTRMISGISLAMIRLAELFVHW